MANGGVPLGVARFSQETGIRDSDWRAKIWVRWGDAFREAGFKPNQLQTAYDEEVLIAKLIGLARDHHFHVAAEIKMKARSESATSLNVYACARNEVNLRSMRESSFARRAKTARMPL